MKWVILNGVGYPQWSGLSSMKWVILNEVGYPQWSGLSSMEWVILNEVGYPQWSGLSSMEGVILNEVFNILNVVFTFNFSISIDVVISTFITLSLVLCKII